MMNEVQSLLREHDKITIVTHLNPDADTIGTALGIYGILKSIGKQVEVVNYEKRLPLQLDFLPNYSKIKHHIDYENSLIVVCDTSSLDIVGFNLMGRTILNIDHHKSNTQFGLLNIVDSKAVSASQVAYMLFKDDYKITKDIATCFYTALVADTQYFTTNNVSKEIFSLAFELITYGVNIVEVVENVIRRRSLASIRILSSSLNTLQLERDGQVAFLFARKQKMLEAGADILDTVGIIDYGISMATVDIAIILIELENSIRVSMRSKIIDISEIAVLFGGGGHPNAAGFEIKNIKEKELLTMIREEINKIGLVDA
jgi:phosphoesterase RecJ-like protein